MRKEQVLVVDDDAAINGLICEYLRLSGYEAHSASDGDGALREVSHEVPSIIVLDIMLPDIDGYEVCRRLRARPETAQVPVLMLSALGDEKSRARASQAGATEFLAKPFDPDQFLETIAKLTAAATPIDPS